MATLDASQITVGSAKATGAIFVAPDGTTLPTDATTQLDGAFSLLGFTSDEGVGLGESKNDEVIRAWEGRRVVMRINTEYTESVSFTPLQCNADVAKLTWGAEHVTVGAGGSLEIAHHGEPLPNVCVVIETVPRKGIVNRKVGTFCLSARGEQAMDGTKPDARKVTLEAVAGTDNVTMREYVAFTETGETGATGVGA